MIKTLSRRATDRSIAVSVRKISEIFQNFSVWELGPYFRIHLKQNDCDTIL